VGALSFVKQAMNNNDGIIGLVVAIALTLVTILMAAIATTPKEFQVIFGDLKIEYRQF